MPKIETFDGATWNTYFSSNPIDGFAIEHKYVPILSKNTTEEKEAIADKLNDVIDSLRNKDGSEDSLLTYERVYQELQSAKPRVEDQKFSQSVGTLDAYLFMTNQAIGVAEALVAASRESGGLDGNPVAWADVLVASQPQIVGGKAVKVTLRTVERDGTEISGLKMRYMSSGAYKIKCDRKLAATFALDSVNASQVLKRAAWYFWAENPSDNRHTKPVFIDLTTVNETEYNSNFTLNWE